MKILKKGFKELKETYKNDAEVIEALDEYLKKVMAAITIEDVKKANREFYNRFCLDDYSESVAYGMMFDAIESLNWYNGHKNEYPEI